MSSNPDSLREQAPAYSPPAATQRLIDELYREELIEARAMLPADKALAGQRLFETACRLSQGFETSFPRRPRNIVGRFSGNDWNCSGVGGREMTLDEVALRVANAFGAAGIPFMLVGGFSSNYYGIPARRRTWISWCSLARRQAKHSLGPWEKDSKVAMP